MSAHRCGYPGHPTAPAMRLQVLEVTLEAPLSLARQWHDDDDLARLCDEADALVEQLERDGCCLRCGRPTGRGSA